MGKTYEVKFTVTLPDGVEATERQVQEWVEFELHARGTLNNYPVSHLDLAADQNSVTASEAW